MKKILIQWLSDKGQLLFILQNAIILATENVKTDFLSLILYKLSASTILNYIRQNILSLGFINIVMLFIWIFKMFIIYQTLIASYINSYLFNIQWEVQISWNLKLTTTDLTVISEAHFASDTINVRDSNISR